MACIVETGSIAPNTLLAFAIVVENPAGKVVLSDSFDVGVAEVIRPIMRQCFWRIVKFRVIEAGVWRFILRSGDVELARVELEFKVKS